MLFVRTEEASFPSVVEPIIDRESTDSADREDVTPSPIALKRKIKRNNVNSILSKKEEPAQPVKNIKRRRVALVKTMKQEDEITDPIKSVARSRKRTIVHEEKDEK